MRYGIKSLTKPHRLLRKKYNEKHNTFGCIGRSWTRAVFVVSKTLFDRKETKDEATISIIVAARDIDSDEELVEGSLTYRDIPKSVLPHGALLWEKSL